MKNRYSAFLIHLLISGLIALIAVFIVFFVWYPAPLHDAVGVTRIFLILLGVDIAIGPLITLIIYKPGKPSLKFDLTVIALLQLSALLYGMATMFQGRPAFIVYTADRFEIGRANDIDPDSLDRALKSGNESAVAGWARPRWVGAVASSDPKRAQDILFSSVQGGPDWPQLPELFVPLSKVKDQVLAKAKPMQELRALHGKDESRLQALSRWKDGEVKWLPLRGKVKDMVVLVDAASADVIDVVDLDPWQGR
ncbi:MAG: TfpX/TfpZ family type IV pilin accessory protein [Gammaproteobacteria bacterium]